MTGDLRPKMKDLRLKWGFTLIKASLVAKRSRLRRNLVNVQAFTLIEILVVISITGFLVIMGIASYNEFNKFIPKYSIN